MTTASLILIRHGNTFEADETPVWVGARTDLPLTQTGEAQARAAGNYVAQHFAPISAMIAGPLKRTQRTAALVAEVLGKGENAYAIDGRLREVDYGKWEGLSGEVIAERFGASLEQWEQHGVWPTDMGWAPPLPHIQAELSDFLADMWVRLDGHGAVVAVTSNGILRLIHRLVAGHAADKVAKVKTGHICVLEKQDAGWRVAAWNVKPSA